MGQLLEELRRRNVFRVSVAYVIVTWLVIQVSETGSEPLGLPDWTEAFFIVLMLAGLPVVVLFAWVFELTPEGLKKTEEVDTEESVTNVTGKKLNYTIIVVLVMALGYFLWERQGLVEQAGQTTATQEQIAEVTETPAEASIAVLPFVNMSNDPDQEYFSDGISEELLNLLAKIPDLRVPARTSSFQVKGQSLDIGEVAKQLNVTHVREGSVRKADVRGRVTAQLIEADTGYHLWSDTYDRELDDIFSDPKRDCDQYRRSNDPIPDLRSGHRALYRATLSRHGCVRNLFARAVSALAAWRQEPRGSRTSIRTIGRDRQFVCGCIQRPWQDLRAVARLSERFRLETV